MDDLEKLLKELRQSLSFLSYNYHIRGYTSDDLKQLMLLKVIDEYPDYKDRKKGWWFMRLKWHLFNLVKKESRNPLSRSVDITIFNQEE